MTQNSNFKRQHFVSELSYYSFEGLYTAISKTDLENLYGPIRPNSKASRKIIYCLERAKTMTLEILGTSADAILAESTTKVPAILSECIEVQAAIFLSAESAKEEAKKHLSARLKDAKSTLVNLRNLTISPVKTNHRIRFGESE